MECVDILLRGGWRGAGEGEGEKDDWDESSRSQGFVIRGEVESWGVSVMMGVAGGEELRPLSLWWMGMGGDVARRVEERRLLAPASMSRSAASSTEPW